MGPVGTDGETTGGVTHLIDPFFMDGSVGKRNREKDEEDVAPLSSPSSCPPLFPVPWEKHNILIFGVQQNQHFGLKLHFLFFSKSV